MGTLTLFFILAGFLIFIISIPMIRGKVKPNGWYGFRIPLTLDHPEIWYPVNRLAGWLLLAYGVVVVVAASALPQAPGMTLDAYAYWMAAVALGGLLLIFVCGWLYARRLAAG
jgi:uncharacterized membrane protein